MKAEINERGVLTVKAENAVEAYALHQWWISRREYVGPSATLELPSAFAVDWGIADQSKESA